MLIDFNKLYNLATGEIENESPLEERENILTVLNEMMLTEYKSEDQVHELRIYKKNDKDFKTLTFQVDEFHYFKNTGKFILILKDNFYYIIDLRQIMAKV